MLGLTQKSPQMATRLLSSQRHFSSPAMLAAGKALPLPEKQKNKRAPLQLDILTTGRREHEVHKIGSSGCVYPQQRFHALHETQNLESHPFIVLHSNSFFSSTTNIGNEELNLRSQENKCTVGIG